VRLATWNIRAARTASVEAIAAELAAMNADVIGLQEVDSLVRRTGFVDQPTALARALGYHHAFGASVIWDGGDYGLAVLSRWPLTVVRRHRLASPGAAERRIVLDVTACVAGRTLRVLNHHADFRDAPRQAGLAEVAALVRPGAGEGLVVLGDFNEGPSAPGVRSMFQAGLVDAVTRYTAPAERATAAIDYLLVDARLAARTSAARVWLTDKSDHHALLVDLDWEATGR
jgi:endonuclease/exonuclease/phosphatase family metal-dependent hydrolase